MAARKSTREKCLAEQEEKKKRPRKSEGENDGTMDETMVKEGDGEERSGSCDVGLCVQRYFVVVFFFFSHKSRFGGW